MLSRRHGAAASDVREVDLDTRCRPQDLGFDNGASLNANVTITYTAAFSAVVRLLDDATFAACSPGIDLHHTGPSVVRKHFSSVLLPSKATQIKS
jgi:hypothetical protein